MRSYSELDTFEKGKFRLAITKRSFSLLSAALVISAVTGGLYKDRIHFIFALCALGAVYFAVGWFKYLILTDERRKTNKKNKKSDVPYSLKKDKNEKTSHKPAFLRSSDEFNDDLSGKTAVDEEIFDEKTREYIKIYSYALAGILLFVISFIIPAQG